MFLPEDIDLGNAQKYILTVRIKSDGFSFLIQDSSDKDTYTYQETAFVLDESLVNNVQKIIFDLNFLTDSFQQVNVIIVSSTYEQIPKLFFDPKNSKQFFNFTHSIEGGHVLTHQHTSTEFKSLFNINSDLYSFLKRNLTDPVFYLHCGLLTDYFQKNIAEENKRAAFVHLHDNVADIICFDKNRQFLCAQSYMKEEEENIAYYALNLWEKLGFDQYTDHLYIYGNSPEKEINTLLGKYIKEVRNIELTNRGTDMEGREYSIPLDVLILSE